ncbi:MAG: DUF1292 domain-containing protein [Clostridia bacterium]|nr:DUF1292 domain-containing protein [Clostridia bacterium]
MYEEEQDFIVGTDEDGNEVELQVLDYFFYNGEEYAILTEAADDCCCDCEDCADHDHEHECDCDCEECGENDEITCFIMKVVSAKDEETGEEYDEFVPVEDEALEAKLIEVATTKLDEEADLDNAD